MNRQDLIDYLSDNKWYLNRIEELKERKILLEEIKSTQIDGMPKGKSEIHDRLAEELVKLIDETDEETLKYIKVISTNRPRIVEVLEQMENATYRDILDQKYLMGKELEEIAVDKKMGYKHVCNLHGYALNDFDELCEKIK